MQVEEYLIELINDQGYAILPGFGAFVLKEKPAYWDKRKGKIYPPTHALTFNAAVQSDNSALPLKMVQNEAISLPAAERQIQDYVDVLHSVLNQGDDLQLDGVGVLSLVEDKITFKPSITQYALSRSKYYGLSPLYVKALETPTESSESTSKSNGGNQIFFKVATIFLLVANLTLITLLSENSLKQLNVSSLLSFGSPSSSEVLSIDYHRRNSSIKDKAGLSDLQLSAFYNFVKEVDELNREKKKDFSSEFINNNHYINSATSPKSSINKGHFIISGCFSNEQNAKNHLINMKSKGFNPNYIYHNGMYKVYLYHTQHKSEAIDQLLVIKQKSSLKNWIMSL